MVSSLERDIGAQHHGAGDQKSNVLIPPFIDEEPNLVGARFNLRFDAGP